MTGFDVAFVVLAVLDMLFIVWMGLTAYQMLQTAQRGSRQSQPLLKEAKALADRGTAMVTQARDQGMGAVHRVQSIAAKVRQRVETTRRIIGELKPAAQETVTAVRDQREDLVKKTRAVGDMTQRLARVRAAAQAAVAAARDSS
jgi:hypothetical protein